jgi:mono/diheme cytochrome c family protein
MLNAGEHLSPFGSRFIRFGAQSRKVELSMSIAETPGEPEAGLSRRRSIFPTCFLAIVLAIVFSLLGHPQQATALPTFAQAYQVDCDLCHTMVPALNAYGRYVQSTAFGALDPATMRHAVPLVVREAISYRSTGKLDAQEPQDKYTYGNLSVNLVGVLNKYLSYRFEQTLYSNNLSGGNTGHFWISYNQLLHGDGHLIVGKLDAPAPPAFSFWQDASGFASAGISVGQHGYNLGGTRWGVGFNYVPADFKRQPYRLQLAYVGNSPSMYNATVFSSSNPYGPYGSGSDKAFQYRAAWARPDKPFEAGVYGTAGTYILSSGYVQPIDRYNAVGIYAQRDPLKSFPGLLVFYQQTGDSNIGPSVAAAGLSQSAISRAFAFELDEPFFHGDVMLAIRPVEYLAGLQASRAGYDVLTTAHPHFGAFDIVARDPKFSPYVYITIESAVAAASNATYGQPAWRVGLRYAAPIFRAHPAPATQQSASAIIAASTSAAPAAGQAVYAANCAACHGASGTGGVGPNLHQVAATMTLDQTVAFIEKPAGAMPKLFPGTLSAAQVQEVAAYVRSAFH